MLRIGDIDPAYPAMLYLADRYEFNIEQRYWLAWLYAACYHAPTAFYMYNEFPDFENVDIGRLERWWKANRQRVTFQTDRRWVRSRNQFCEMFASYRSVLGGALQEAFFAKLLGNCPKRSYARAYKATSGIKFFGRYALFLYLESVAALTGLPVEPDGIDLRNSQSSRNGLCYAYGYDQWLCGHDYGQQTLRPEAYQMLDGLFGELLIEAGNCDRMFDSNVWNVETSLCAYKKVLRGKRYLGYYIDRQHDEIRRAERLITEGVDWSPLWDFRAGHFEARWLKEARDAN
jgi:hypothetical protein